jgi:hypothetical protein
MGSVKIILLSPAIIAFDTDYSRKWLEVFISGMEKIFYRTSGISPEIVIITDNERYSVPPFNDQENICFIIALIFKKSVRSADFLANLETIIPIVSQEYGKTEKISLLFEPIDTEERPLIMEGFKELAFPVRPSVPLDPLNYFDEINKDFFLWQKLLDVVSLMVSSAGLNAKQKVEGEAKQKIFLCNATSANAPDRDNLKNELISRGVAVFPDESEEYRQAFFTEDIEQSPSYAAIINECQLVVHFASSQGAERKSLYENQLIKEIIAVNKIYIRNPANRSPFQYIWAPYQFNPQEGVEKTLYDQLVELHSYLDGSELVLGNIEDIKSLVINRLKMIDKSMNTPTMKTGKQVYLIHHYQDSSVIQDLELKISQLGFTSDHTVFINNTGHPIRENLNKLLECDIAVILGAGRPDQWIQSKLKDIFKLSGYGRKRPFEAKVLVIEQGRLIHSPFPFGDIQLLGSTDELIRQLAN